MIFYVGRLVGIGLTYTTPPYPFIAYSAMEFLNNLFYVAVISYSSIIAPQSLIATAISIGSVMCWILGRGMGALLAGVVVARYNMRVMFVVFGVGGSIFFLAYWMLYHLLIKKYEIDHSKSSDSSITAKTKEDGKRDEKDIILSARVLSTRL